LFDLVESIEVREYYLRQHNALYFGAPGGGVVLAPALALQFGASGGRNSNAARELGIYNAVDASFAAPTYTSTVGDALSPLYLLFVPHQINQALYYYYSNSAIYDHSCYLYDMRTSFIHRCQID
jgi:hypothetical protein